MQDGKLTDNRLKVFISNRESKCDDCGEELGSIAWILLRGNGAACLTCADLDHQSERYTHTVPTNGRRLLPNTPAGNTGVAWGAVLRQRN